MRFWSDRERRFLIVAHVAVIVWLVFGLVNLATVSSLAGEGDKPVVEEKEKEVKPPKVNHVYRAAVSRVIDGDTIEVTVTLGLDVFLLKRLRVAYIDTPELRGGTSDSKAKAMVAKIFVEGEVGQRGVIIQVVKFDSFGRIVADVWYLKNGKWKNLGDELLRRELAIPYKK